jgi:hypothetical protein
MSELKNGSVVSKFVSGCITLFTYLSIPFVLYWKFFLSWTAIYLSINWVVWKSSQCFFLSQLQITAVKQKHFLFLRYSDNLYCLWS